MQSLPPYLAELLNNVSTALIELDCGVIKEVNNIVCETTGMAREEIIDKPFSQLFNIISMPNREPFFLPQDGNGKIDARIITNQGQEISANLSYNVSGQNGETTIVFSNFTKCGHDETSLDQQKHFRRLNIIGQLTGGVAHDINNMLGGIMGCAELLSSQVSNNERNQQLINTIYESSVSASDLNSKLLSFSRKDEKHNESFDAHAAIEDTLDLLRRSIDRRIDIDINFYSRAHFICGCPADIKSAILNIGINARDAMPNGGSFTVTTADAWLDIQKNPNPEFPIQPGNFIKISFTDTGNGITPSMLKKIFIPYFTTKINDEGTGLGLSAVAETVRDYNGTLTIESELGEGTTICLYLPVTEEISEKTGHANTEPGMPIGQFSSSGSKRILLADDEELMRAALGEMLKTMGHTIMTATNGEEAVKIYLENSNEIDLVILDLVMPKMDGADAFTSIKALNPDVRAIVASGYTRNSSFDELEKKGVKAFLRKPFTMGQLSNAIEKALASKPDASKAKEKLSTLNLASISITSEVEKAPPPKQSGEGMSVLLVEDDEVMREIITSVLESRGYNVMALENGADAALLIKCGEEYPLYIFDINLPGTNGFELCQLAKANNTDQPVYVIVITSDREHSVHHKIFESGGDDFIAKPFTLDLLSIRLDVAENILANSRRRIEAENALRASEERMSLAINNAELGIWELDLAHRDLIVSPMWRQLTGCPEDFPGGALQYLQDITAPDTYNNIRQQLASYTINDQEVFSYEAKIKHPTKGNVWLLMVGKALKFDSEGKAMEFSGFCQDITIRKLVELSQERQRRMLEDMVMERTEELSRINQELMQEMEAREKAEEENLRQQKKLMDTEKLASLGTLVSGVGHEINNPTQFIMLNMPFIKGVWESALPVLDDYFQNHPEFRLRGVPYALARERMPVMSNDILEGAERINHIVRELKDYARQGTSEKYEMVDMAKIVDSAQTLLGHFIKQHTDHFIVNVPQKQILIEANATRIEQVIINLVQNSCLALEGREKRVTLTIEETPEKDGINIIVEDEGHGIEERHLRHLTDPFFTTRQSSGGTGLGLSICERIVHNHKGELNISSTPAVGTRVMIYLPYHQKQRNREG